PARFGFLFIRRLHQPKDFFLVRPNQAPYVDQHYCAQPSTNPDFLKASVKRKGRDKIGTKQGGAREPGCQCRPPEIEKCTRSHVLRYAGGRAITLSCLQRSHLNKVEVVQQADPHDAGQYMNPTVDSGEHVHGYPPDIVRTMKYRTTVSTRPTITVLHKESSGFVIFTSSSTCLSAASSVEKPAARRNSRLS